MSDELDLNEFQAAEAEEAGEGFKFKLGDDHFELPGVMPLEFLLTSGRDLHAALTKVLGDDAAKFWSHEPGRKATDALFEAMAKHYGFGKFAKSSASAEPSLNGTGRSRPTSAATTG